MAADDCVTYTRDANGATLNMDQKAGAKALLLNCSIDAHSDVGHKQDPWDVSEIYMANKDVELNLTFVNFTNCHDNMIMINHDKTLNTVTMRGTNFCNLDKSETSGSCATTAKGQLSPGCAQIVKNCSTAAEKGETLWHCGERAKCTDLYSPTLNMGLGMHCSCVNPALNYQPPLSTSGYQA